MTSSLSPPSLGSPMVEDDENMENNNNNNFHSMNDVEKSEHLEPPLFTKEQRVFAKDGSGGGGGGGRSAEHDNGNNDSSNNELLYQAIIKKAARIQGTWKYLVHYQGWNSRWDCWMEEADILAVTPESQARFEAQQKLIQQQQQLRQQQQQQQQQQLATSDITNKQQQQSRKRQNSSESLGRKRREPQCYYYYSDFCELPFTLKAVLMEECEKMTRKPITAQPQNHRAAVVRAVHNLPSPVPARKVIDHFVQRKLKAIAKQKKLLQETTTTTTTTTQSDNNNNHTVQLTAETVETFGKDLIQLFQHALPKLLLYPQERPQYDLFIKELEESHTDEKKPMLVDIYGCEYLLRLVVRLPVLLQPLGPGDDNNNHDNNSDNNNDQVVIGQLIADLVVLMQKNRNTLFPGNYRAPRPEEYTAAERAIHATL